MKAYIDQSISKLLKAIIICSVLILSGSVFSSDRKPEGDIATESTSAASWVTLQELNPGVDANGQCPQSFTSGGFNAAPVWVTININLAAYANQAVAIRWLFDTRDGLFNDHQGWFVDNISIGPLKDGSSFTNGADTDNQRNVLFMGGNSGENPGWHATTRRSFGGSWSWWYGNESTNSYEGQPDSNSDPCFDRRTFGQLFTPVIELGGSPTLSFRTLWSIESVDADDFDLMRVQIQRDTDMDGLLDDWEIAGVDIDLDGTAEVALAGANPDHKDIFIEIDYMVLGGPGGHSDGPKPGVVADVTAAFAAIPISNPDGINGINLHVDVDDVLPHTNVCGFGNGCFDATKSTNFDPNRKTSYHYSIWGHRHTSGSSSSGIAEVQGNDFMVTLGAWTNQGTRLQQAGTFMHELGHNLNLIHGGSQSGGGSNFKPHYLSVMNYFYQVTGMSPGNVIRYSYEDLGNLNENALRESGIPAAPFDLKHFCPGGGVSTAPGGPRDWNCNGIIDCFIIPPFLACFPVAVDINNSGSLQSNLMGHDDRDRLDLIFGDSFGFADGVRDSLLIPKDEIVLPLALRLENHPDADTIAPVVEINSGLVGPNGFPAVQLDIRETGTSGLESIIINGPNIEPIFEDFQETPAAMNTQILVESTDREEPVLNLFVLDFAANNLDLTVGDKIFPFCELKNSGFDSQGNSFIEIEIGDDIGVANVIPVNIENAQVSSTVGDARSAVWTFTKIDNSKSAFIELKIFDRGKNMITCKFPLPDPVVPTVTVSWCDSILGGISGTRDTLYVCVDDVTGKEIEGYLLKLSFDQNILKPVSASHRGTISEGLLPPTINTAVSGQMTVVGWGTEALSGSGPLVCLVFDVIGTPGDTTEVCIDSVLFNAGTPVANISEPCCPYHVISQCDISGQVLYCQIDSTIKPVPNTTLILSGGSADIQESDRNGKFTFEDLLCGSDYWIKPNRRTDGLDSLAVNSADAFMAANILAGNIPNTNCSPKAADVDEDGILTPRDLSFIEDFAIGNPPNALSHAGEWRFTPEACHFEPLATDESCFFQAILLGDVDTSWPGSDAISADYDNAAFGKYSYLADVSASIGEIFKLPFLLNDNDAVSAADIDLFYDPAMLRFTDVTKTALSNNFKLMINNQEGRVRIGMYAVDGQIFTGHKELITLNFEVIGQERSEGKLLLNRYQINGGKVLQGEAQLVIGTATSEIPSHFDLAQNFPNPFNPTTEIRFDIPQHDVGEVHVQVRIFNVLGELIRTLVDEKKSPGRYVVQWDSRDDNGRLVSSGIYLYQLQAGEYSKVKKMNLLR